MCPLFRGSTVHKEEDNLVSQCILYWVFPLYLPMHVQINILYLLHTVHWYLYSASTKCFSFLFSGCAEVVFGFADEQWSQQQVLSLRSERECFQGHWWQDHSSRHSGKIWNVRLGLVIIATCDSLFRKRHLSIRTVHSRVCPVLSRKKWVSYS